MAPSRKQRNKRNAAGRRNLRQVAPAPQTTAVPASLFKYISSERISLLTDGLIRFTQPGDLNDPFEIRPILARIGSNAEIARQLEGLALEDFRKRLGAQMSEEQLRGLAARAIAFLLRSPVAPLISQAMTGALGVINNKIFPESINKVFGVMSLSETARSSLMWAHYGESYQGIALEFDTESPFFECPEGVHEDFGKLRKVIYSDRRPVLDFAGRDTPSMEFLYTKPKEWGYEAEWRMLRPLNKASRVIERTPFTVNLFSIPPKSIKSVILGYRVSKDHFDYISGAIEDSAVLSGAALRAVTPRASTFELEVIPINSWEQLNADVLRSEAAAQDMFAAISQSNALADVLGPQLAKKLLAGG
jgi:Protein of unknown function (DUF2971)